MTDDGGEELLMLVSECALINQVYLPVRRQLFLLSQTHVLGQVDITPDEHRNLAHIARIAQALAVVASANLLGNVALHGRPDVYFLPAFKGGEDAAYRSVTRP